MLDDDTFKTKVCNKCKQELPESCFSKSNGGNYFRPECRKCNSKLSKESQLFREQYGDPPKDYTCPICNRSEENVSTGGGNKKSRWVIDHDHKTNIFRGWLCHTCNMGLGAFYDNEEILQNAINYLKKPKSPIDKDPFELFENKA